MAGLATAGIGVGMTATELTIASTVTSVSTGALAAQLSISEKEAEEIQRHVKDFQEKATLIRPAEKYIFRGSLSLTMTVYVMNDLLEEDKRDCWTGATHNSERKYTISKDFPNLAVEMKPQHMVIV